MIYHNNTPGHIRENMRLLNFVDRNEALNRNDGLLCDFILIYHLMCHHGDPWITNPQTQRNLYDVIEELTPYDGNLYGALCAIYGDLFEDMTLMIECIHDWEKWANV